MKKIYLLLTMLLMLVGASPTWADELTIFESSTQTRNDLPIYGYNADTPGDQCEFVVPASLLSSMNGKNITGLKFYTYNFSWGTNIPEYKVYVKEVASTTLSAFSGDTDATTVYTGALSYTDGVMTVTFSEPYEYNGGNLLIGTKVSKTGSYIQKANSTFYGDTSSDVQCGKSSAGSSYFIPKTTFVYESASVSGPAMTVKDGTNKIITGYSYNFGLATVGTTKTFTLKNPGDANVELNVAATTGFAAELSSSTLAAGSEVTLTVTMNATGDGTVTITSTTDGIDDFVINVSGTVRDASKMWCDFSEGLPSTWNNSGNWSISTSGAGEGTSGAGYAYNTSYGNNKLMSSPLVTIAEGEKLYFMAKGIGSTASWNVLRIQYSADGYSWTTAKDLTGSITNTWQSIEVTEIPAGNWYIGFYGSYVYFTDIYGGTESTAPVIVLSQNSYDFGLISTSTTTPTPITITNTGKSALTGLNITSDNANFTVAVTDNATTIAADGGTATFSITMVPNATGVQSATITIKSDNADDLTFTATGAVAKPGTATAEFNDETLAGWTKAGNTNFNSDETAAYFYYSTNTLTSPKLTFVADDFLAVKAKLNSSDGYVTVKGSTNGTTFTEIKKLDSSVLNQTSYATGIVSGISTDYKYIQLDGKYCYVKEVVGLTYVAELSVTTGDPAVAVSTPANYDFGECKANATVTYNFANASSVGTISITNVAINGDGAAAYSTNWTESVAAPFALTITRAYDINRTEAQEAVVTVTTSEGDFVINVTGTDWAPITTFPWTENFNGITSGIPAGWDNTEGTTTNASYKWNSYVTGYNGRGLRFDSYSNSNGNTNFLKTPIMNLPAGKDMQLKFWYKNPAGGDFSVYISNDGGETYTTELATGLTAASSWTEKAVSIPSGFTDNVVIVFKGTSNYGNSGAYIDIDDVTVQEQEDGANFAINTDGSAQAFGSVKANATAEKTYTITNNGNKDMFITITNPSDFTAVLAGNAEDKNVYFTDAQNWGSPNIYYWPNGADWPGEAMTQLYTNDLGQKVYYYALPEGVTGIIFNGGSNQTVDITDSPNGKSYYTTDTKDVSNHYTVGTWEYKNCVPAGKTNVLTVSMNTETPGDKSGDVELTFDALNATSFTIPCTGTVKDPNLLEVDFEDNAMPENWQVGTNWAVASGSGNYYAVQSNTKTASALVTTPLNVEEGKQLSFKVARNASDYGYVTILKLRTSEDGGVTWGDYSTVYDSNDTYYGASFTTKNIDVPTGNILVEFFGSNIKLDDIQGVKNATKPAIAVTESAAAVANGDTKEFGFLNANGTATYTVKNIGNATLNATISGDGVTVSPANIAVAAGETADITVTLAYAEPYGSRSGMKMTIDSEDAWISDFVVNFEATLNDPTAFVEDFSGNATPDGWYNGGWTISGEVASIAMGTSRDLITKKVEAAEGKNVLTFKARYSSNYLDKTLKVYTSTDRKTWTLKKEYTLTADYADVTLDALENGQYYVKFEAANAIIDNVTGLKKVDLPAHDLFEISNTIAATGAPENEFTATVTGISLIADEADIVAELWIKKSDNSKSQKVASLEGQSMTANTSKTFTLTGNLPNWDEGNDYKMYITVKKSDDAAYFNTDEVDFTLAHNVSMAINSFTVTTPEVQADDNNEYTATYNIKVTNSGTRDLNANEVSVSLVNKTSEPDVEHTATWTLANSQTVFLNPGNYTTGANMAIYRWNDDDTNEQKEWALFTKISDDFYSAELNGKKNFIICRVNPETAETDLAWDANVYNQSTDLTTAAGNIFGNNGYNASDGKYLVLTVSTMANLPKGVSTTLQVTVNGTLTDGENKNLTFYAREDVTNTLFTEYSTYASRTATITAAPVIILDEAAGTISSTGQNRKVQLTRSFVEGWNTICLPFETPVTTFGTEATAYAFKAYTTGLQFEQAATLEAGKPYLIHVPAANDGSTPFELSGVTVSNTLTPATDNGASFIGTFEPKTAGSLTGKYGVTKTGKIQKAGEGASMKGFRAYFELPNDAKVSIIITDADGNTTNLDDYATGINRLFNDGTLNPDEPIYNTQGQQVSKSYRGVVIQNGKKFVIK
jgi:hypothetical protein